jgi:hypothetical protein
MDEEKIIAQMIKAKKSNYIIAVISALSLLVLAAALLRYFVFRSENPRLTPEGINEVFTQSEIVLLEDGGKYYECSGGEVFALTLNTGDWSEIKAFDIRKEPYIRIHIAEQYEVYVYPDGRINTYDGYAGTFQKSNGYYYAEVYNALKTYLSENGIKAAYEF